MFGRQQPQKNRIDEIDEHEQPTEPMSQVILSPFAPTLAGSTTLSPNNDQVLPSPRPAEHPFPQQSSYNAQPQSSQNYPPQTSVYPFLPPAPRMTGNGQPVRIPHVQQRRSAFPLFVGTFFVAVQLLLLVRFVLQLFVQPGHSLWITVIYALSSFFVLPFRLLLQNVALPVGAEFTYSLAILLAILMYGLLSRILVRFLKALLNSR